MLNIPYKAISFIKISTFFYYTYTHLHTPQHLFFFYIRNSSSSYLVTLFFFLLISSSIANTNASRTYIHNNALRRRVDFPTLFNLFIYPFFLSPSNHPHLSPFFCVHFFLFLSYAFLFCHLGSSRARLLYVTAYMRPTIYPHLYKSQYYPPHH